MINFRYDIRGILGEGGSGIVYLAEDGLRPGLLLALKILHPRGQHDSEEEINFRNEVSLLMRLDHPHLAGIRDFGIIRNAEKRELIGRRFLAMEYVLGIDALTWLKDVTDRSEQDKVVEALLLQALGVLSYIHSEGVIHFDIKPHNMIVLGAPVSDPPPLLKLIDFGLSAARETPTGFPVRGTLEFTAPELLQGGRPDYRVDLYSLGATFYRLLEGHCPFEASSPVELVKKVLKEEPTFSSLSLQYPARLVDTIKRLMQRDPAARFPDALAAIRWLTADQKSGPAVRWGFAGKSGFVGHEAERDRVEAALLRLANHGTAGKEGVIIVSGGTGMGKSAFLAEMAKHARALGLVVAEVGASRDDFPFRSIMPALRRLAVEARSLSAEGRALAKKYRDAIGLDGVGNRERSIENIAQQRARFVSACARMFPFLLLVDDLRALDVPSLLVLQNVARSFAPGRAALLAADARPSPELFPGVPFAEVRLGELKIQDIERMCRSVLGQYTGVNAIAAGISRFYGGVPAVVLEALRTVAGAVSDDLLSDEERTNEYVSRWGERPPVTVEEFFISRVRTLSREEQLVLEVLSCFKYPAPALLLEAVLPMQHGRLDTLTRLLEFDGYLGSLENHGRVFVRLEGLKNAVYDSIPFDRAELHATIADAIVARLASPSFTDIQELAHQYLSANNAAAASQYFEKAGDEGVAVLAYSRAIELYGCALDSASRSASDDVKRLRIKIAETSYRAGMYTEAIRAVEEIYRTLGPDDPALPDLLKTMGLAQSRLGEFEEARSNLFGALLKSTDPIEEIELRQELVGIDISVGHFQDAERTCLELLERARLASHNRLRAAICIDLGIAVFMQGRLDEAMVRFHDALDIYTRLEQHTGVINAMMNIGNVLNAKGERDRAIVFWEDALRMSGEHGTLNQAGQLQNNLGIAYYGLKQYDRAKRHYQEALSISARIQSKSGQAYALSNLGEVLLSEGEYEQALHSLEEAREAYRDMGDSHGVAEAALLLGQLWLTLGALSTAAECLDEGERSLKEGGEDALRGQLEYLRGILSFRGGDAAAALERLQGAGRLFEAAGEEEKKLHALVQSAESLSAAGRKEEAVGLLANLLNVPRPNLEPLVQAEAYYILGSIAVADPGIVEEKPVVLFKRGIEACAKEPVSEITWKLAYALALEYHRRGQKVRSKEHILKARLVLELFLSHITSPDLKSQYLLSDGRQSVLATADRFLNT